MFEYFNSTARRARKIRKLEDSIDDKKSYLSRWGFGLTPSQERKLKEDIESLQDEYQKITGKTR